MSSVTGKPAACKNMASRTWQDVIDALIGTKLGANRQRRQTAAKNKALAPLLYRRWPARSIQQSELP